MLFLLGQSPTGLESDLENEASKYEDMVQEDFINIFVGHIFDHGTVDNGGLSVSFVDFFNWDSQSFSDVVDGFVFCKIEERLKKII